jgi:hypothetical protein
MKHFFWLAAPSQKKKLPQETSHVRDSTIISPYVTSYYFQHLPVTLHCEKSEEEEKEEER